MAEMTRITVSLPKDLHSKVKIKAAATGVSMSAVCRKALKAWPGQEKFERAIVALPKGKWFSEDELKAFVESITQDQWWAKRSRQGGIETIVMSLQSNEPARVARHWPLYEEATLNLPPGLWCKTVVLHELAHVITPVIGDDMHGQKFIENWCAMLQRYTDYGKEARTILEEHGFPT